MNILDIQNPKFLKKLKKKDLEKLSEDIRKFFTPHEKKNLPSVKMWHKMKKEHEKYG